MIFVELEQASHREGARNTSDKWKSTVTNTQRDACYPNLREPRIANASYRVRQAMIC